MLYKGELVINGRVVASKKYSGVATHPHQIAKDFASRVPDTHRYFVVNVINEDGDVWIYPFDMMGTPNCKHRRGETLSSDIVCEIMAGNRSIR